MAPSEGNSSEPRQISWVLPCMMSQQGRPTLRPGEQGDFSQSSPSSAVHQSPLQQYLLSGGQSLRPTTVGHAIDATPAYQKPVQAPPTSPTAVGRMYTVSPGFTPVGVYQQGIASQSPAVVSQLQRQLSNPVIGGMYVYTDKNTTQPPPPAYPNPPVVSGATIHHRGQSPSGGLMPLANPSHSLTMTTPQRRLSGGVNVASRTPLTTSTTGYIPSNPVAPSPKKSERPRKRQRAEEKPPANEKVASLRKLICDAKLKQVADLKENYIDNLTELYFLQLGLNLVDFHTWKKRPTPQLVAFLQSGKLDSDEEEIRSQEKRIGEDGKAQASGLSSVATSLQVATSQGLHASTSDGSSSVSQPPPYGIASSVNVKTEPPELKTSTPALAAALSSSSSLASLKGKSPLSPGSIQRLHTRQHSISAVYDSTVGSQEAIMERAKQEAQVMQKVAELRKQGRWSSRRLPKVQEPPRNKAHWDYLLEEMQWLAADFAQERKWKKAGCRKIARMITRYHQEQAEKVKKAEKEEANKLKRTASAMAKMVKEFWQQIEKVVQYKQQSRLDEKRKKALDLHLNFIVDQTEKYSTWLTEGLSKSQAPSVSSSVLTSPRSSIVEDDNDFEPEMSEASDDEETIQREEEEAGLSEEHTRLELEALQQESEIPLEDLIQSLPPEILDEPTGDLDESGNTEESEDVEFKEEGDVVDDEDTVDEQEEHEQNVDHAKELSDLAKEGELSIEELLKKYSGAYDSDFEMPSEEEETGSEESGDDEDERGTEEGVEESMTEESASDGEREDLEEVGMEYLIDPAKEESVMKEPQSEGPSKEITDIAATAQSLQPTGYTLETTTVKTAVPFLLKHTLREYQHVGLDWLATLNDRKLNGILADEMGLGKTIQTIALLAHLASHHGVWGPHLIVVPTSVMLNWEMELKKWCPAFKILTYYGSQKERKQKRQGWTKTNAFHVCITSYKLVIQDHQSFRRKKWKYLVLDEAQNIKNFKSQRWQTLLNFSSQRRLLLTGTPLQNSLMELWSLMHFLMPNVFQSHREFKEWFANPLSGMIEGSQEYNENLIKRLHKVLRPFLLRRLKQDVEKQMPKKYEHVVMCRLSKRQRFLYDDFMSQAKTKETLATGHFMSVINILMQLRKVCNHPNLFDPRPITSPFQAEGITYTTASLVLRALDKDPLKFIRPEDFHPNLCELELHLPAFAAHRVRKLATPRPLIEEIDNHPDTPERPQSVNMKNYFYKLSTSASQPGSGRQSPFIPIQQRSGSPLTQSPVVRSPISSSTPSPTLHRQAISQQSILMPVSVQATQVHQLPGYTRTPGVVQRTTGQQLPRTSPVTLPRATLTQHGVILGSSSPSTGASSQPITVQIQHTQQGTRLMIPSGQISQLPGLIQIVQTSNGQQILSAAPQLATTTSTTSTAQTVSASQQHSTTPSVASTTLVQAVTPVQRAVVSTSPATSAGYVVAMETGESLSRSSPVVTSPVTCTVVSNVLSSVVSAVNGKPPAFVKPSTALSVGVTPSASLQPTTAAPAPLVATTVSTEGSTVMRPVVRVSPMMTQAITTTGTTVCQSTTTTTTTVVASAPKMSTRSLSVKEQRLARFREELKIEGIEKKRKQYRENKLMRLACTNAKRCMFKPVYGQDLCSAVSVEHHGSSSLHDLDGCFWNCHGWRHCSLALSKNPLDYWHWTHALSNMVNTPQDWMDKLQDTLNRFVFVTPSVTAPAISLHTSHPPSDFVQADRRLRMALHQQLSPKASSLHPISTRMSVQFPEARLIQYDCGKLQTLDVLLRQLKAGSHRVLIFTQMTRMLDVLEQFLSYHGHRYLRLDGATRVEHRQLLMDRFNADRRIFAFILSTRSGGLGINLTGADTVIFYDSDWNPTMDAQAQDRCHRIGQTRDVHIYRLISEMTVEENILKKANQKRLLGSVAIEGGNFTTAFFKQNTINELFNEPSGLESLVEEEKEVMMGDTKASVKPDLCETQLEQALGAAEDETDVLAAKGAKAEQKAELAEFDEEIPWDEKEAEKKKEEEESKVEKELALLEQELRPVERYAVGFVESQLAPFNLEELKLAEEEVATAKQDWELGRLKALKEEEERRAEIEEDEMLFTYTREDAYNQVYICDVSGENMPLWAPPTPPQDDNDMYIDQTMCFLYEPSPMAESQLPPVYVKRERKRRRLDSAASHRKLKQRHDDHPRVPRSLFDRPNSQIIKMRREAKLHKLKFGTRPHLPLTSVRSPTGPVVNKTLVDTSSNQPEWMIHEDWALLQAIQTLLELPLNLIIINPAHVPNWDLVADVVNATSRVYRSPKVCRSRYENVIVPREEGKILYDINPRKQKKSKGIYKTKNNRPMRTSQLYAQDNHSSDNTLHAFKLDAIKTAASKRTPTLRPTLVNPSLKNPKHAAVLADSGINYDQPSTPVQVAAIRAERIEREKKAQTQTTEQGLATQKAQQAATVTLASQVVAQARAQTAASTVQIQQLQPISTTAASTIMQTSTLQKAATGVSISRQLAGTSSIVVNTAGGISNTFATINKRMNQQSGTPTVVATQSSRSPRSTPVSMQEITAVVQQQTARTPPTTQGAVTTTLTAAQLSQRLTPVTPVSTTVANMLTKGTVQHRQLTPQQVALIRQQQLKRQLLAQQQQQQRQQQGQTVQQQQLLRLQVPAHQLGQASGQKLSVTSTPLITQQTGATLQGQRLQVKPQIGQKVSTRPMTEAEIQAFVKQRQAQQQKANAAGLTSTAQLLASQPQVSRILSQAKLQQTSQSVSTQGGVATLVKTVTTSTLPVTPVSVGGVGMQQQKVATTGGVKTATVTGQPAQFTVSQLQQLQQQQRRLALATGQRRVTSLSQAQLKPQLGSAVQIITQPAKMSTSIPMAQFHQLINKQHQQQQSATGDQPVTAQNLVSVTQPSSGASSIITPSQTVARIMTKVSQVASTVTRTPSISIAIPSTAAPPSAAAGVSVVMTSAASSPAKATIVATQVLTPVQQVAAVIQTSVTTSGTSSPTQQATPQPPPQPQAPPPSTTSTTPEEVKPQEDMDNSAGQKSAPYAMRLRKH